MRGPPPGQPRPGPPPGYAHGYSHGYGDDGSNGGFYAGGAAVALGMGAAAGAMAMQGRSRSMEQQRPPPDPYATAPDLPIGQAIEMDERTGSMPGGTSAPNYGLRDSDADVNGMVGLQQDRQMMTNGDSGAPAVGGPVQRLRRDTQESGSRSPTSIYSEK